MTRDTQRAYDIDHVETLAKTIITAIADFPEDVRITRTDDKDERGPFATLTVSLNNADVGASIGEQGKTADALRRIIGLVAHRRLGERILLKIDAPRPAQHRFEPEQYHRT